MKHTIRKPSNGVSYKAWPVTVLLAWAGLTGSLPGQNNDALLDLMLKKGMVTQEEAAQVKLDLAGKEPEAKPKDIRVYWKNGLNFESADGKTFRGRLGGRIELDTAFFAEDEALEENIGDQEAGVEFRRVWLSTEGEFNTSVPVFYELNLDFSGGNVEFRDVLIGLGDLPGVGSVQAGHFKEPFSLEAVNSERFNTFMERALPIATFAPMRNTGVMIGEPVLDNRMTWALGSFASVDDSGDGTLDSNYRVTGRLTGVPYQEENRLLHLGVAGSFFAPEDDSVQLRARPESHLADYFADTDTFGARYGYLLGLEAAFVCGPFCLQGEYVRNWLDATAGSNPEFGGFYVYGSWFITGESRPYKTSTGVFTRVQPKHSLSLKDRGPGAWELAVRYSWLDLDDAGITGGEMDDITAGLNWYLNPNTRMMFNYVFSQLDRSTFEGDAHVFMGRLQVDF